MFSLDKKFLRRLFPVCAVAPLLFTVAGCANRGNPRPPSLHLPALATNLKAQRVGEQVLLTWTTPDKTSDGLIIHDTITAVLCRELAVSAAPPKKTAVPAPCNPISRTPVSPGETHLADTLPPALLTDPARLLAYRIELQNPKTRSAGVSAPVFAAAGSAPPDPGAIRVTASRSGAVIEWTPSSSPAVMELTRTLVADANGAIAPPAPAPKRQAGSLPASTPKSPAVPVLLRPNQTSAADPGGLLDSGVLAHDTYTYTAQRIRTVQLDGHTFDLRSAPSAAATLTYRDIFPPKAPSGLESIASAPLTGAASIDLSWEAGAETDILGYNIFRAEASGGFARLNSAPVPTPAFRDMTAQPGHSYRYRVTAIDRSGNESSPSQEIQDSLPAQP